MARSPALIALAVPDRVESRGGALLLAKVPAVSPVPEGTLFPLDVPVSVANCPTVPELVD